MTAAPVTTPRPHGPDEVRAAVLVAATDLFAERPPGAVTVREIAERAHVNHALVHRYFGTKEDLMRAVLEHNASSSEGAAAAVAEPVGVDELVTFGLEHPGYLRAFLAVQLSEEWDEDVVPEALPLLERASVTLAAEQARLGLREPALSAGMAVAAIGSLVAAWWTIGPVVHRAPGAPDAGREHAELREAARAIWARALSER